MLPAPAPTPPNIVAMHGAAGAGAESSQLAAQAASRADLAPQPMNGPAVMRLSRRTKLPSGLNSVSSAALLNRLVAVDSAGGVFLSQDGGIGWERVPAKWTGKAVQVHAPPHALYALMPATGTRAPELTSTSAQSPVASAADESTSENVPLSPPAADGSSAPSPAKPRAKDKGAATVLPLQFKLVTDRHQVWVSSDGKVWREQ